MDDDDLPGVAITELMRLGHAYLSISDPQLRIATLRMVEETAGAVSVIKKRG